MRQLTAAICLAVSAGLLSACVGPTEPAGTATVGDDFVRTGGIWSSGGALIMAAGFREVSGRIAVCGAWTTTPQSVVSKHHNQTVVEAGSVAVGRESLVLGLGFMTRLREGASLDGAAASCVATARPWEPGLEAVRPNVFLPRLEFEFDEYEGPLAVFLPRRRP